MNRIYKSISIAFSIYFLCLYYKSGPAEPFPIQFSIPQTKIVKRIPKKDKDFASIVPDFPGTYISDKEEDYYKEYQRSYFAVTSREGGWDGLRHYEILANGCIPYFTDLERCPTRTMTRLPKDLILEAMNLEGVHEGYIDHEKFNKERYYEILQQLLEYTREQLTTKSMAEYALKTAGYSGKGKILYLSQETKNDYLACLILIGLKELLGPENVIDVPKVAHIYSSYTKDIRKLKGKGMTYTHILTDIPVNRENIEDQIKNKEFDLVIYGSVHRGLPYLDIVQKTYAPEKIIYFCGEDLHSCDGEEQFQNLFLREIPAL